MKGKNLTRRSELMPGVKLGLRATVSDAFKAIGGRFGLVVAVVGPGSCLRGIVSEGDLRRAILSGRPLDTPLESIMNPRPVSLNLEDLGDDNKCANIIDQVFKRYETGQGQQATIPVVDDKSRFVGLATPETLQIRSGKKFSGRRAKSVRPRVLVVGGAGYIGSVLVRMLLADGWRVRVLDNMLYDQVSLEEIKNKNLSIVTGDATNANDLVRAVEDVDAVVYLAEIVGDPACEHSPERALKTNYLAVANMAHLCSYLNIQRFVYTSSCSVYGGGLGKDDYLTEESRLNPVSHYARMKIMSEQALMGISNPLFAPTILRLATVFGYSHRPRFDLVVNAFAKNAFFKKSIEVFGGSQWRPNIHVKDVARAVIKVLDSPIDKVARQTFNTGSNECNHTIDDLAGFAERVFSGVKVLRNNKAFDRRDYRVDFSKINDTLGFKAGFRVEDGLAELKKVFVKGLIRDPEDSRYSNIQLIKRLADRESGCKKRVIA